MDINEINNGRDYAQLLMNNIEEDIGDSIDSELKEIWFDEIEMACEQKYQNYILGIEKDFTLTEKEMFDLYEKSGMRHTEEIVNGLIDKGFLDAFVNEEGGIVYKLSKYGKEYFNNNF